MKLNQYSFKGYNDMAYKTEDLFDKAKSIIEEDPMIFSIYDVIALLPCNKGTFYNHFKDEDDAPEGSELNYLNQIKDLLTVNKVNMKKKLRGKMLDSDNATNTIALYKLIATQDERRALSHQHHEHASDPDNPLQNVQIIQLPDNKRDTGE